MSDQSPSSPAASLEILPHSMKNVAFDTLPRSKMITLTILAVRLVYFSLKGWENALFDLGNGRVTSSNAFSVLQQTPGRSVVTLSDVSAQDAALFTCEASNGLTDDKGDLIVVTVDNKVSVVGESRPDSLKPD